MALINCPECGKEVSDQAISCPNCGYVFKKMDDTPKSMEVSIKNINEIMVGISVVVEVICLYFYKKFKDDMGLKRALYYFDNLDNILRPYKIGLVILTVLMIVFALILAVNIWGIIKKRTR